MEDTLREFLETAKDWAKIETDIDGVFVVKIPATKTREAKLMVEVNPVNKLTKQPKKRKGLFIADFEMYLQFQEALMEDEVPALIKTIEGINPESTGLSKVKKLKLKD